MRKLFMRNKNIYEKPFIAPTHAIKKNMKNYFSLASNQSIYRNLINKKSEIISKISRCQGSIAILSGKM